MSLLGFGCCAGNDIVLYGDHLRTSGIMNNNVILLSRSTVIQCVYFILLQILYALLRLGGFMSCLYRSRKPHPYLMA